MVQFSKWKYVVVPLETTLYASKKNGAQQSIRVVVA